MTELSTAAEPDRVADAERLDRLLSEIGDEHGLPVLYEDCRRLLHGVIVELERLQRSETALTATIRAYPDAVANSAANLAHARAQRDEMTGRVTELRGEVKELYAKLAERDAEIEVVNEERAYWKQLYDDYCKPEDISAMEIARDEAVRRADETEEQLRELAAKHGDLHAQFKDRSDYAQRVWLAWCSARDRARGRLGDNCNSDLNAAYARIRELEAERDAGVLEYLRTHPDETRRIIERERQRLAAPPDIVRRAMGEEFQP